MSGSLRDESDVVRRLEQQVEVIRRDLAGLSSRDGAGICARCATPLDVHDQFSHEVRQHLLRRKHQQEEEAKRRTRDDVDFGQDHRSSRRPRSRNKSHHKSGGEETDGADFAEVDWSRRQNSNERTSRNVGGILKHPTGT